MRFCDAGHEEAHRRLSADEVGELLSASLVGHVDDVHPGRHSELFAGDVRAAALTRGSEGQLARLGFRELYQLLDRPGFRIGMHAQHEWRRGNEDDGLEVPQGVIRQSPIQCGVGDECCVDHADRAHKLQKALAEEEGRWDVCLIDCPPSLGMLTINALVAADSILVPLQCEFFALEGLSQLLQTVERIQNRFNASLSILGVALTMFDRRNRLTDQVAEDVRSCLGDLVFETVIPRNVRLSEAPSHGLPALIYDHRCTGSEAYMNLARELIARLPAQEMAA